MAPRQAAARTRRTPIAPGTHGAPRREGRGRVGSPPPVKAQGELRPRRPRRPRRSRCSAENEGARRRVVRPVAVNRTEVYAYPYTLKGAPDELNRQMVQSAVPLWASAAGFGQPDDIEAFVRCQNGMQVTSAEWVLFQRGLRREQVTPDGEVFGDITDEVPQRGIYREWKRLLSTGWEQ